MLADANSSPICFYSMFETLVGWQITINHKVRDLTYNLKDGASVNYLQGMEGPERKEELLSRLHQSMGLSEIFSKQNE